MTLFGARSLRFWLLGSHGLVLVLPLMAMLGVGVVGQDMRRQTRENLVNQGSILALGVEVGLAEARKRWPDATIGDAAAPISYLLTEVRQRTLAAVRILDAQGIVVASSGDQLGQDLSGRAEVRAALRGTVGEIARPRARADVNLLSQTSRTSDIRLFVAHPCIVDGKVVGVVVLSRTPWGELQAIVRHAPRLWGVALLCSLFTLVLSIVAGQFGSRSLKRLARASQRYAEGGFGDRADVERAAHSHVREVAALATSMDTMREQLQARLSYISEFAGNVSHEFKTPISTLRGTFELLRDDPDIPEEQRQRFLSNALIDLERMDRLVTGLLALARAEESMVMGVVNLDALLAEAGADGIVGRAGLVRGNQEQLKVVVQNLIGNARQHGRAQTVNIEAWRKDEQAGFDVVDDGVGISEANLSKVFERFFTTDRDGGGTGVGLALVNAIVAAHGGEVTVDSQPGCTRFKVCLRRSDG